METGGRGEKVGPPSWIARKGKNKGKCMTTMEMIKALKGKQKVKEETAIIPKM